VAGRALIDTSAWIEFFHPHGDPRVKAALVDLLQTGEALTAAPVLIEVLWGARTEADFALLTEDLTALTCLPLGPAEALAAARLGWTLGRQGHRVPVVDLLLAGAALVAEVPIWHYGDGHFRLLQTAGGLAERDLKAG